MIKTFKFSTAKYSPEDIDAVVNGYIFREMRLGSKLISVSTTYVTTEQSQNNENELWYVIATEPKYVTHVPRPEEWEPEE